MSDFAPVPADILAANASGIKLFGRWDAADVEVKDISLTDYIQVGRKRRRARARRANC